MIGLVNEFRKLLERIFEQSRRSNLSYRDFFSLLIRFHGYAQGDICDKHVKLVEEIRKLDTIITRLPDSLHNLRKEVQRLKGNGYKPFLVDCLGLPEAYEVYIKAVERYGVLGATLKPFINAKGWTQAFTQAFGDAFTKSSMHSIARELGTSLYKSIDNIVHKELGEPMELDGLINLAEARLRSVADGIAKDAINARKAFIVADHGYDIIHSVGNRYHLGHGHDSKLARIAPIIVIEYS